MKRILEEESVKRRSKESVENCGTASVWSWVVNGDEGGGAGRL
jgi:hypothetical protein